MNKAHNYKKGNHLNKSDDKTSSKKINITRTKVSRSNISFFDRSDIFLSKYYNHICWFTFAITVLFGVLLFDIRFSISGDDSAYVERAYNFIHYFKFPGFQGPLYPIVLSPIVAIFGLSAIPLKFISLLFILGSLYYFFKSFKDRVPVLLTTSVLFLLSINSFILYYGSQTYSEAFFMFLQAFTIGLFFNLLVNKEDRTSNWKFWIGHLLLIIVILCLGMTRFIGFSFALAVTLFFITKKQWKNLLALAVCLIILLILFFGFKLFLSSDSTFLSGNVLKGLLSKDYYNPALGQETISGFMDRFIFNSNFYISNSFYSIMGLRGSTDTGELYPLVTVITCFTMIIALFVAFRKNVFIFFIGIYTLLTLFIIFLIAHTIWIQSRFIVPYVPLILILLLSLFYYSLSQKRLVKFQFLFPVIVILLVGFSIMATSNQIKEIRKIEDKYYGLTADWDHYCRLSEWTASNLPKSTVVACRKPTISFIFSGGNSFYGITRIPYVSKDSLLKGWNQNIFY